MVNRMGVLMGPLMVLRMEHMSTVSLTYDELAERLGIGRKSAQNTVRRKGWRRTKGNDGRARIEVPLDALPDTPSVEEPVSAQVDPQIPVLEAQIEGLKALVAAEKARADAAESDRDRWHELAVKPLWKRAVGL